MAVRRRLRSRVIVDSDSDSNESSLDHTAIQESARRQSEHEDRSSSLSDVPDSVTSDNSAKSNDLDSDITPTTNVVSSPTIQTQSSQAVARPSKICILPIPSSARASDKDLTPTTKIPSASTPSTSGVVRDESEEVVSFFEQGGTTTSDCNCDIADFANNTGDDFIQDNSTLESFAGSKSTSDISTINSEKEEDSEVGRLVKRVEAILQDWETLKTSSQPRAESRRSVYHPSEFTKALARKVTGMGLFTDNDAILAAGQVMDLALKKMPEISVLKMEEFKDESSQRRIDTRAQNDIAEDVEHCHKLTTLAAQEPVDNTDRQTGADSPMQDTATQEASQGVLPTTMNSAEPASENPTPEATRPPLLATRILEAVSTSNRKTHTKGDVAIIIDADDLRKTVLLSSDLPLFQEDLFLQDHGDAFAERTRKEAIQGFKYILIVEANRDLSLMPTLTRLKSNDIESGDFSEYNPYFNLLQAREKVKIEPQTSESNGAPKTTLPRTDWIKVYEAFFSIIANRKGPSSKDINSLLNLLGSNAGSALPQIEGLIEVAKLYRSRAEITISLTLVIQKYIGNSTLFDAVAAEAASWLLIGIEAEDDCLFKEAFCHVAGCYPHWPWNKPQSDISKDIMSNIKSKSRDLATWRQAVQVRLSRVTLCAPRSKHDRSLLPVNQDHQPHKYDVVNYWWHWIAGHFAYLEPNDHDQGHGARNAEGGNVQNVQPSQSPFCDHADKACLNVARLYRAIAKGGDAYLSFDQMMNKWNEKDYGKDEDAMRDALDALKKKAKTVVEPLVRSPLLYARKDELDYLTCIVVNEDDMPWKKEYGDDIDVA